MQYMDKNFIICSRGVRSGSLNISTRDDQREQVSTILVNISVNEAVVFKSIFQLLVVLALLGRILDADWSENDVRIGWSSVYCSMGRRWKALRGGYAVGPYSVPRGPDSSFGAPIR